VDFGVAFIFVDISSTSAQPTFGEKDMLEERSIAPFVDVDASVVEAPRSPMMHGLHKLTPVPF
jgi:hypothetical protein